MKAKANRIFLLHLMVFIHITFFALACSAPPPATRSPDILTSHYVRYNESLSRVIVFIHGFTGNSTETWTNEQTDAYWPELLTHDSDFDDYNIYVYEYPTSLFNASFSIDEITENMRLFFDTDKVVTQHQELVFIVHSMGGIVTRAYLNKYDKVFEKVSLIYFFSTPTTGSDIANLAHVFVDNPQITQLAKMTSESYLADVQRSWLAKDHKIASYCAYEKRDTSGVLVVGQESASNLCNKRLDPLDYDHINMVNPAGDRDPRYLVFKSAFLKERLLEVIEMSPVAPTTSLSPVAGEHIFTQEGFSKVSFRWHAQPRTENEMYGYVHLNVCFTTPYFWLRTVEITPSNAILYDEQGIDPKSTNEPCQPDFIPVRDLDSKTIIHIILAATQEKEAAEATGYVYRIRVKDDLSDIEIKQLEVVKLQRSPAN